MSLDPRLLNLLISYESPVTSSLERDSKRLAHFAGAAGPVKASHFSARPMVDRIARHYGTRLFKGHLELPSTSEGSNFYNPQVSVCRVAGKRGHYFASLPNFDREFLLGNSNRGNNSKLKSIVERGLTSGKACIHFCFIEPTNELVKNRFGIDVSFDIRRDLERHIAVQFKQTIKAQRPGTSVNLNIPYLNKLGSSDHLLRQTFSLGEYLALKIMISPDFMAEVGEKKVFDLLKAGMNGAIKSAFETPS